MKFTKKEMYLLDYCFDINNGDNYLRYEKFPKLLKQDFNISKRETEEIFKSLEKKFDEFRRKEA